MEHQVPHQSGQWRCVTDAVMTADPEGIQCRGFRIPDGGLFGQGAELARAGEIDPQQAAPCVGSRSRSRVGSGPVEKIAELDFGPVQNRGVTSVTRNTSKTAGEPPLRHARGHAATCVFPRPQSRLKTPSNAAARSTPVRPPIPYPSLTAARSARPPQATGHTGRTMSKTAPVSPEHPVRRAIRPLC